jgi:outer membrane protein insertion porin family
LKALGRVGLVALVALLAARAQGQDLFGRTVVSVSCVADGPIRTEEIAALVTLKAGRPLTEEDTASTLRNVYATGRFADARIEAVPDGDGVAVTLVLFRAYRIHPLEFRGTLPVSRAELRKILPFSEGALYSEAALRDGAVAISRRLQAEGYLSARAQVEVTLDRENYRARVTYVIEPGPAALVVEPFFDGDTAPLTVAELLRIMKLKPGTRFRESVARADATRLTEAYQEKTYYRALVELIAEQPVEGGRLMPVYRVRVGPRVVFEASGIKAKKVAKDLKALAGAQPLDEEIVLQYVEGLKDTLQRSGHYRAKVTYVFDGRSDPEVTRIEVNVVEGPKYYVEAVRFEGNAFASAKKLYELMGTHRRGLPLIAPGRLVDSVLAADAETILAYYQSEGFIRAKVPPLAVEDGEKPGGLVVVVAVAEGPRAFVKARAVEEAEHLDAEVASRLRVKEGAPFNPNAVQADVGTLAGWYHDHGFREAAVHDSVVLSEDGTKARITYRVDEGDKSFFGKTIVRGNTRTKTAVIERLASWMEGDPLSEAKILDTQRALSRAGVFRRVDIRPQRSDPSQSTRNVDIDVEEGRPWSLLYGVGYRYAPGAPNTGGNTSDPYLSGGVSYNNLLGRMISAGFEAQYAPFSRLGRFQVLLREPFLFGTSYPLNLFGFYSRELIQDVELERRGVALNSSKIVARGLRIGLTGTYEFIQPTNPESFSVIDQIGLPAINRPIDELAFGPDVLFDRRDDIIDPHSGYYLSAAYKYASAKPVQPPVGFPLDEVKVQFSKFSTQATGFLDLGRRWTLVASARVGGVFGTDPAAAPIPIAERFFAGGRSTERAFDTDLLGIAAAAGHPLDPNQTVDYSTIATPKTSSAAGSCASVYPNGFPNAAPGSTASPADYDCTVGPRIVGGKGFLALNVELRIPIVGNLGAVVFYDAAQVWRELSQVGLRFEGSSGLRQGAGLGLRFMTPIGPARVEYGWPLMARTVPFSIIQVDTDPRSGKVLRVDVLGQDTVRETGRFFFSIGYPF